MANKLSEKGGVAKGRQTYDEYLLLQDV